MGDNLGSIDDSDLMRVWGGVGAAGMAVQAALSRVGCPYAWGTCGPNQFDCSGLVRWSYGQAGVHLDGNSTQLMHQGIPVSPSQAQPGDLVFPSAGHVQMYIGNNQVVEAPYTGASVQVMPLGGGMIRRMV